METIESPAGLEAMTEQLRREIHAYVWKKVGDPSSADDLTQETLLRVQRALIKGTKPEHFSRMDISDCSECDYRLDQRKTPIC